MEAAQFARPTCHLRTVRYVDLAYLYAHPEHLPAFLTHQRIRETPVHGGSIGVASRLTLDDGNSVFMKSWPEGAEPPDGFFAAESAGLAWLRKSGGVATPTVIASLPRFLVLEWLDEAAPTSVAARAFGAALAVTHHVGSEHFGAPRPGFIGSLPLDNTPSEGPWSAWFAARRLTPYLRISRDRGALSTADVAVVERLIDNLGGYAGEADAEPPSLIHGDLWPGNLLWTTAGTVHAIDPAAHGGHRETDLANLALFGGAPHRDEILAGYQAVRPLSTGWVRRVPMHQLHLLLAHTAMFGASYRGSVLAAVRATVER